MMLTNEEYDTIYSKTPRICLDFIILNKNNKALYTKRDQEPYKNYWHTPGGRILFRETTKDAIKRILKRETGIENFIVSKQLIGICEFLNEEQGGSPRHSVSIFFEIIVDIDDDRFFEKIPDNFIPEQLKFLKENGYN